jgi:hypothetical protein
MPSESFSDAKSRCSAMHMTLQKGLRPVRLPAVHSQAGKHPVTLRIDAKGNLQLRLDSGRSVAFNIKENPHLDYGYAVTSHSSQGQTADRVLVNVDTER